MIYRLDTDSGHLYTEEEFWYHYSYIAYRKDTSAWWETLPAINVPEGMLEEIRSKLLHVYGQPAEIGSVIANCAWFTETYFVYGKGGNGTLHVENTKNRERQVWKGPYIVLTSQSSFIDNLKNHQILYNKAMNKNGKTI